MSSPATSSSATGITGNPNAEPASAAGQVQDRGSTADRGSNPPNNKRPGEDQKPQAGNGPTPHRNIKKPKLARGVSIFSFFDQKDVWIKNIFPFLGIGYYAFVGAVDKKTNAIYKEYCNNTLAEKEKKNNPPYVRAKPGDPLVKKPYKTVPGTYIVIRRVTCTDTFYSAAFFNVATAEFWLNYHNDNDDKTCNNKNPIKIEKARLPYLGVCAAIARLGNLEVLLWAYNGRFSMDEWTCYSAAQGGHLHILQWARNDSIQYCEWDSWTCCAAARHGHLEILQWARQKDCPWDPSTCAEAAQGGHLDILQWARDNGCQWDESTCAAAALSGHLDILKWARQNRCPWDEETCSSAAEGGHLEVLKWAIQNGCLWNAKTCSNAAMNGHFGSHNRHFFGQSMSVLLQS